MKNIEELKQRIKDNLSLKKDGYFCIGRGVPHYTNIEKWLSNYFHVEVYCEQNGHMVERAGNDENSIYYISDSVVKNNNLLSPSSPSLEERLLNAQNLRAELLKKDVRELQSTEYEPFAFDRTCLVTVLFRTQPAKNSIITNAWFKDNPTENVCVVFSDGYINYPVDYVIPPSEEIIVKVNDKYNAKVTKDKIIVGCQEIDPKVIGEIANTLKKLQ